MFRPEEAMFRENTDVFLYTIVLPEYGHCRPKHVAAIITA
jgi:hypothetical protein